MRKLLLWIFCFTLCLAGSSVGKQAFAGDEVILISKDQIQGLGSQGLNLSKSVSAYFHPRDADVDIPGLVNGSLDAQFFPLKKTSMGYSSDFVWLKVVLRNTGQQNLSAFFLFDYASLDAIHLYERGRAAALAQAGDTIPRAERTSGSHLNALPFTLEAHATKTYYLHVTTTSSLDVRLRILDPIAQNQHEGFQIFFFAIFLGGFVVMFFYNIGIALAIRRVEYFVYSLFLFVSFIREAHLAGIAQSFLFPQYLDVLSFLGPVTYPLSVMAAMLFCLLFLELRKTNPKIAVMYYVLITCCLGVIIYYLTHGLTVIVGKLMLVNIVSFSLITVAISWYRYFKGYREARFFALAWTVAVMGFFGNVFTAAGLIDVGPSGLFMGIIGQFFEIILLSFAFGDKIKRIREAKEEATEQMQTQLKHFNRTLQDKVQEKTRDIRSILDNVPMGIMPIELDLKKEHMIVGEESSAFLSTITHDASINGKDPFRILFRKTDLSKDAIHQIKSAVLSALDSDPIQFDINRHVLPDVMIMQSRSGMKYLSMDWSAVINEQSGKVDRILLVLKDITEVRRLEMERRKQEEDMAIVGRIVKIKDVSFLDFLRLCSTYLDDAQTHSHDLDPFLHQAPSLASKAAVARIYHALHTMKGLSRAYGMLEMSDALHRAEDFCHRWNHEVVINAEDIAQFQAQMEWIGRILAEYRRINFEVLGRHTQTSIHIDKHYIEEAVRSMSRQLASEALNKQEIAAVVNDFKNLYMKSIQSLVAEDIKGLMNIARKLGKEPPFIHFDTDPGIFVRREAEAPLRASFIHILRNSIYHGIECADERRSKNKAAHGVISIASRFRLDAACVELHIGDDGRGLQIDEIGKKALAMGIISAEELAAATPQRISELTFHPGFSTAKDLNDISGRGVGMEAIREYLAAIGGSATILLREATSERSFAFTMCISIPMAIFDLGVLPENFQQSA